MDLGRTPAVFRLFLLGFSELFVYLQLNYCPFKADESGSAAAFSRRGELMSVHPALKIAPLFLIATRASPARQLSPLPWQYTRSFALMRFHPLMRTEFNSFISTLISPLGEETYFYLLC